MPSFTLSDVRVTQGKQDDLSLATGVDYCSKALATLGDVNLAPLLPSLHKLNLKQNQLSGKRALVGLRECTLLTWLNLQENQLGPDLDFGLGSQLSNLLVLNLSHNSISKMSHHLYAFKNLKALILNNNQISKIENCSYFDQLTTLVLSHNNIDTFNGLQVLPDLQKLSIAHNSIRSLPFFTASNYVPQLLQEPSATTASLSAYASSANSVPVAAKPSLKPAVVPVFSSSTDLPPLSILTPQLKELRLNNNKITGLPAPFTPPLSSQEEGGATGINKSNNSSLVSNLPTSVEILDLGSNMINQLSTIIPALRALPNLHQLSLKGNACCLHPNYRADILEACPALRVLDGERFDMKFLERKEKRAAFDKIKEEKKEVLMEKKAVRKAVKLAKETGGVVCSNPTKKKDVDNDGQVMMQVDEQEVGHQHQKEVGKEGQVLDPAAILELQKKYDRLKKIKKEHKKQLKLQQVASSATTNTGITTATSSSTLYADGNVTETKDKKKKKEDTSTTTEVKVKSSSSSSKEQVSNPPKSIITPAPKSKRSRLEKEPSAASSSSKRTKRDHVSSTADFFLAQPDSGAKTTEKELVTQKSSSSITTVKKNTNEEPTSIPLVVIESLTVKALPSEVSTGHTGVVAIVDKTKKGSKKKQKLDANIKNGKEGAETTTKVAFNPLELEETGEAALTVIGGWD